MENKLHQLATVLLLFFRYQAPVLLELLEKMKKKAHSSYPQVTITSYLILFLLLFFRIWLITRFQIHKLLHSLKK